jgi:hypothetical protein
MKFANTAGFVKLRNDFAATQAQLRGLSGRVGLQPSRSRLGALDRVLLVPQPFVQIRDAKAPAFADVDSSDHSAASQLLQRLRMNAEKSSRFDGIEQRLKLGDSETRLSGGLS